MNGNRERTTAWLVANRGADAEEAKRILEETGQITVGIVAPEPDAGSYAWLAAHPDTGAVIFDRCAEQDGQDHGFDGIDVANYLRGLRPELPIFALVGCADGADGPADAAVFDMVIDRAALRDRASVTIARMLRGMGRYEDAMNDKLRRIRQLVDRSIALESTQDEERELAALRGDIERPGDSELARINRERRAQLDGQAGHLSELKELVTSLTRSVENVAQRQSAAR